MYYFGEGLRDVWHMCDSLQKNTVKLEHLSYCPVDNVRNNKMSWYFLQIQEWTILLSFTKTAKKTAKETVCQWRKSPTWSCPSLIFLFYDWCWGCRWSIGHSWWCIASLSLSVSSDQTLQKEVQTSWQWFFGDLWRKGDVHSPDHLWPHWRQGREERPLLPGRTAR